VPHLATGLPLKFKPGVPEAEFLKHFPLPYKVQAVTIYEAQKQGWATEQIERDVRVEQAGH